MHTYSCSYFLKTLDLISVADLGVCISKFYYMSENKAVHIISIE